MTRKYKLLAEFNKRDEEGNLLCRNFNECKNPVKKPYRCYCSDECRQKILREAYSFDYFRSDCLKRDNYTCQKCGAKDSDSLKFHDYNPIEVHHINPVKDGGSNDKSNGITLCFRCHVKAHRELKNERLIEKLKLKRKNGDFKKIENW